MTAASTANVGTTAATLLAPSTFFSLSVDGAVGWGFCAPGGADCAALALARLLSKRALIVSAANLCVFKTAADAVIKTQLIAAVR